MSAARWLNLDLVDSTGALLSDRDYTLSFDGGEPLVGRLDERGRLSVPVPPQAKRAALVIATRRLELALEGMPPADSVAGAQERLNHLNFACGEVDGDLGPVTSAALKGFQAQCALPQTGQLDQRTAARLHEEHGS